MKIMIVFGTRPEAIKLAPVIRQCQSRPERFKTIVCVTAQHRQMLDQVLGLFEIVPQHDLNVMTDNQSLYGLTSKVVRGIGRVLQDEKPDMVVVQGDTTTTFVTALAAYYSKTPVAHVEAGLRTDNKFSPYPEEGNRRLATILADLHFAPTEESKNNLLKEGVDASSVFVTGNTVIDALKWVVAKHAEPDAEKHWDEYFKTQYSISFQDSKRIVLVTGHRRESFGEGFLQICKGLSTLAQNYPNADFIYPVHLNPNVQQPVNEILGSEQNVRLIEPLDYEPFVYLMNKSHLILTDSGGVQEEAPSLGKPVLVMRNTTERPEGVRAGVTKLVGTDTNKIIAEASLLLSDQQVYERMSKAVNPYGDGRASERVVDTIAISADRFLGGVYGSQ